MGTTICRFCDVNQAIAATTTVTASSEVVNRPASNLKSQARWKKWRSSTGTGNQTVTFAFGGPVLVRNVSLVDYKAHQGGGIRADYWNGAAFTPFGTFVLPGSNPTGVIAVWDTVGKTTTQIQIVYLNTATANDYADLGVASIGDYTEPVERGLDVEFEMYPVDPASIVTAVGGQEEAQTRPIYRIANGLLQAAVRPGLDLFRAVLDRLGVTTPFVFAADPTNPDEVIYARLTDLRYPRATQRGDIWQMPVMLKEMR